MERFIFFTIPKMFAFKKTFPSPAEKTAGTNAKKYIVVHHTGTGKDTIAGVLDGLYRRADYASCHFVVDWNGDAYKIGSPDDILWHAGVSEWGSQNGMNPVSLGIEIIGPDGAEGFTSEQRATVRALVQHLMATFGIPKENVLRHADLTWAGSATKKLWDGKSPSRKVDVSDKFWKINRTTWKQYQDSLVPKAA